MTASRARCLSTVVAASVLTTVLLAPGAAAAPRR